MNEYLTRKRSSGDYGRQETLPPSLQTKMNQSFGMDFSSVKVYRNDEMAGTGMQGLASGNRVILSKEIDLNSKLGQAVLGHELSHIHAQSQGIGMGNSGLYDNAALEHQADREGIMAANGQPIFGDRSGMNMGTGMQSMGGLQPLSGGLSASAGAPMQAMSYKEGQKRYKREQKAAQRALKKGNYKPADKSAVRVSKQDESQRGARRNEFGAARYRRSINRNFTLGHGIPSLDRVAREIAYTNTRKESRALFETEIGHNPFQEPNNRIGDDLTL